MHHPRARQGDEAPRRCRFVVRDQVAVKGPRLHLLTQMYTVNRMLGAALDAALSPFEHFPPLVGLSAVSLVVAIAMLLVFRKTSDQPAITNVKRRIQAGIFEIRLFNADVRALYAMSDVLRRNLTYLWLSLAPLPWLIVPLTLLIAQLQFYYGYEGFLAGQTAVVKVRLRESD